MQTELINNLDLPLYQVDGAATRDEVPGQLGGFTLIGDYARTKVIPDPLDFMKQGGYLGGLYLLFRYVPQLGRVVLVVYTGSMGVGTYLGYNSVSKHGNK